MLNRSALEIPTRVTFELPFASVAPIASCVVYSYDSDGRRMPERPTITSIPRRGATARPVPSSLTYAAPTPIPTKPNSERLNGRWNDGSTRADHNVADSVPALRFVTSTNADSSKLLTKNQPIDGEIFIARMSCASVSPAEPP